MTRLTGNSYFIYALVIEKVRLHDNRLSQYKKRGYKNFQLIFGGNFSLKWFFPTVISGDFNVEDLYH